MGTMNENQQRVWGEFYYITTYLYVGISKQVVDLQISHVTIMNTFLYIEQICTWGLYGTAETV